MNLISIGFTEIENADDIPVGDLASENQLLLEALQDFRIAWQARA